MPNKITTSEYDLANGNGVTFVDFTLWLQKHPQGGVFKYGKEKLKVEPQQNLYNTVKNKR